MFLKLRSLIRQIHSHTYTHTIFSVCFLIDFISFIAHSYSNKKEVMRNTFSPNLCKGFLSWNFYVNRNVRNSKLTPLPPANLLHFVGYVHVFKMSEYVYKTLFPCVYSSYKTHKIKYI
jgi:hypothetical protein